MTPQELLREAKRVLYLPMFWTKGATARNELGEPVMSFKENARRFCATGAVYRACQKHDLGDADDTLVARAFDLLHSAAERRGAADAIAYNDRPETRWADVIELFDDAIAQDLTT